MPVLVVPRSGGLREYFRIQEIELVVGRSETCEIFVNDGSVSRRHAKITPSKDGFFLEDLGSKNGTAVNGKLITRGPVKSGDVIHFGDVKSQLLEEIAGVGSDNRFFRQESFPPRPDILPGDLEHLGFLFDLMPAAPTLKDEKTVCKFAASCLAKQFRSDNTFVALYDNAKNRYYGGIFRTADKESMVPLLPPDLLNKTTLFKKTMLLTDVRREIGGDKGHGISSAVCAPMISGGELQGVVYIDRDSTKVSFEQRDAAVCTAMAAAFASLIFMTRMIGHLRRSNKELKQKMEGLEMVGRSPAMTEMREKLVSIAAKAEAPALILGEPGTGRSLAARMIHRFSRRSDKPFLTLNCNSFPPELLDSELFGHVRDAFPGAHRDRRGLLELADKGTLLIKNLDAMPGDMQEMLFRFLESGEFTPIGTESVLTAKVRIIAAVSGAPTDHIQSGSLRADLFFKLHALNVEIPPLRERSEDIPLLADHFLKLGRARISTPAREFSHAATDKLKNFLWPGNVMQLQKVVDAALYACDGEMILPEHILGVDEDGDEFDFDQDFTDLNGLKTLQTVNLGEGSLQAALDSVEKQSIQNALKRRQGDEVEAAADLSISLDDLKSKIRKYELD